MSKQKQQKPNQIMVEDCFDANGKPLPGSAARQAIVDQLASVNLALARVASTAIEIRLNASDPLYLMATYLYSNSDRALAVASAALASEQMRRRQ